MAMPSVPWGYSLQVETPSGHVQIADTGDWIVKDSGGFWVCSDELFQRKYEPETV